MPAAVSGSLLKQLISKPPKFSKDKFPKFQLREPRQATSKDSENEKRLSSEQNKLEQRELLYNAHRSGAMSALRVPNFPVLVRFDQAWQENTAANLIARTPPSSSIESDFPAFLISSPKFPPLCEFVKKLEVCSALMSLCITISSCHPQYHLRIRNHLSHQAFFSFSSGVSFAIHSQWIRASRHWLWSDGLTHYLLNSREPIMMNWVNS